MDASGAFRPFILHLQISITHYSLLINHSFVVSPFPYQFRSRHGADDVFDPVLVIHCFFDNQLDVLLIVDSQHTTKSVRTKVLDEGSCDLVAVFEQ